MRDAILTTPTLGDACRRLVDMANARGGDDNITVVLVHIANDQGPEGRMTLPAEASA